MATLYSDLLFQAGFSSRKADEPAVEWVAQLDGVAQYWQLSEPITIPPSVDFSINLTLSGSNATLEGLMEGSAFWIRFLISSDAVFFNKNAQAKMGSSTFSLLPLGAGVTRDGADKSISILRVDGVIYSSINGSEPSRDRSSALDGFTIDSMGKYVSALFGGVMSNFSVEIDGTLTSEIPLTNKVQGATQLATVGSVNATMINYTEAVWKKKVAP